MWRNTLAVAISLCLVAIESGCKLNQTVSAAAKTPHAAARQPIKKQNVDPVDENNGDERMANEPQWDDYDALKPDPPEGSTAECVDETYSKAKLKKDACRDHRGVLVWLADVRPRYK